METSNAITGTGSPFMLVDWRLLPFCTFQCSGCEAPGTNPDYVLVRPRLYKTVENILAFQSASYFLNLLGGEPALHPVLPEIMRLFFDSRRSIQVTLPTNASLPLGCVVN